VRTINAPPIKEKKLKVTIGVDSIHIRIDMNKADLARFCKDKKYVYKEETSSSKYNRKWFIFLADGEPVTTTYHSGSHMMTFEIGKMMNYSLISNYRLVLQQLISYFHDRKMTVGKLDISADTQILCDNLIIKQDNLIRCHSTTYANEKGYKLIVYDKSQDLAIFSTVLTRFELRLKKQLSDWKVTDFLSSKESVEKLIDKVIDKFTQEIEIYSTDRLTKYVVDSSDIETVLLNFVGFLYGDSFQYKDHFSIKEAVKKRDIFQDWMKRNRLKPSGINRFIKGRRAAICKEIGLSGKTLKKAISFYKAIPNFKFTKT